MANDTHSETYIIKLGGSLIVPSEGIATTYLRQFQLFIRKQVADHQCRFFIFAGGGLVARQYRDAGMAIVGHELSEGGFGLAWHSCDTAKCPLAANNVPRSSPPGDH